jgi:predicted PurR-regulated permease PerM
VSVARALRLSRISRVALLAACAVIVLAGVRASRSIVAPFLLAAFVAAVSLPALEWLRRHRVRTGLAILAVVLLNAGVLAFFAWIVLESVVELRLRLPAYVARGQALEEALRARLLTSGIDLGPDYYATLVQPERLLDFATAAARNVTSLLTLGLLILLYLVFMLAESVDFPAKWRVVFGERSTGMLGATRALRQVQRYLVLKTLISLATGTAIGLFTWLLGLDFALFWGFLAFVLNFIPSIGSVIAAVPAIIVALLQFGPGRALAVAAIYLAVNFTLGNVADPIIVGRQLRLSPLVVLMSLVFWGFTLGLTGMFLAVPLTIAVRIMMQASPTLARYAVLMGPLPQPGQPVSGEWSSLAAGPAPGTSAAVAARQGPMD